MKEKTNMPKKQTQKKAKTETPVDTRWENRRVGKDTYFQITLTANVPAWLTLIIDDAPDEETAVQHALAVAAEHMGWFDADLDGIDEQEIKVNETEEFYSDQEPESVYRASVKQSAKFLK